jgi:hypothetical protein
MSEEILKDIRRQNEILISLLGRLAFKESEVKKIVMMNKKEELKQKYVDGYNACDGKKTQSEIATIIGIAGGTLSPIINEWVDIGIIFEIKDRNKKYYKKLFKLTE